MSVGGASVGREGKEVVSTLIGTQNLVLTSWTKNGCSYSLIGTQNLVLTTQIHYYLYNC